MKLEEIKKRAEEIQSAAQRGVYSVQGVNWAADIILQLCAEVERLETQLEFMKEYFNPADTRFRTMIDSFKTLSKENQIKLIDLSKALLAIKEADEVMK